MSYRNIVDRQLPQRSKLKFIFLKKGTDSAGITVVKDVYVTQLPFYENIVINESRKSKYTYYSSFKDDDPEAIYTGVDHRNFRLEFNLNLQHLLQETSFGEENIKNKEYAKIFTPFIDKTTFQTGLLDFEEPLIPFSEQLQKNYIKTLLPEVKKAQEAKIKESNNYRVKRLKQITKNAITWEKVLNPAGTKEYDTKTLKDVEVKLAVPLPKGYPVTFLGQPTPKLSFFERSGEGFVNFFKSLGSTFTTLGGIIIKGRPDQQFKIQAMLNTLATGMIKTVIADFDFNNLTSFYSKTPSNFTPNSAELKKATIEFDDVLGSFGSTKLTNLYNNYVNSLQFSTESGIESNNEVIKVLDKIVFLTNLLRASVNLDKEENEKGEAPLVILNHGILYQNVPCFVTNYQISISSNTPYDTDTLLPYNISVSLDMFESKQTAKRFFDLLNGTNTESSVSARSNINQIGWESVIKKPFSLDLTKDEVIF